MLGLILLLQALTVAVAGPPTSPEYLPLRLAAAEGAFAREGAAVTLVATRTEVAAAEALAAGRVDLAATSLDSILRFGPRLEGQEPRLVLGLTAAPPVALLASAGLREPLRSVRDLKGRRVGISAPGAPEHAWLSGMLSQARLTATSIDLVSLGVRRVAGALARGDVQAALVHEPAASDLLREGQVTTLADLRTPESAAQALGTPTMNAGVFGRRDRLPGDESLRAFARAVLAAERLIADESATLLAGRLPPNVVGAPDEFARRLEAARALYLSGGLVSVERLKETVKLLRAHMPLPAVLRVSPPEEMRHQAPLEGEPRSPAR